MSSVFGFAQEPTAPATPTSEQINEMATKAANGTRLFLDGHSNLPGVTVELKESSRDRVQGRLVVKYRALAHGSPVAGTYTAYAWPINTREPQTIMEGVTFRKDGVAMCAGRRPGECGSADKPDDPIEFAFFPAPGEPIRLALMADDKSNSLMFGAVPLPISKTDRGCTLDAIRLLPKWEITLVRGTGFRPNESVHFKSTSAGEVHESDGKANAKGEYIAVLLPAVQGKSSGTNTVQVTTPTCSPAISYEWGKL